MPIVVEIQVEYDCLVAGVQVLEALIATAALERSVAGKLRWTASRSRKRIERTAGRRGVPESQHDQEPENVGNGFEPHAGNEVLWVPFFVTGSLPILHGLCRLSLWDWKLISRFLGSEIVGKRMCPCILS
jgi:hypothetical protein